MGAGVWDVAVKNLTMFFHGHVLCFYTLKLEHLNQVVKEPHIIYSN